LIGIVSGYYPQPQQLYVAPDTIQYHTHSGISTAVPVEKLYELLKRDELKEMRNNKTFGRKLD
jgi:hypothetical protein